MSGKKDRAVPEWWDAFLSRDPSSILQEQPAEKTKKKKRRRKHKSRKRILFDTGINEQQEPHRA
jgi:hypothetical protein